MSFGPAGEHFEHFKTMDHFAMRFEKILYVRFEKLKMLLPSLSEMYMVSKHMEKGTYGAFKS